MNHWKVRRPMTAAVLIVSLAVGFGYHVMQNQIGGLHDTNVRLSVAVARQAADEVDLKAALAKLKAQQAAVNAISVNGTAGNCRAGNRFRAGLIAFAQDAFSRSKNMAAVTVASPTATQAQKLVAEANLQGIAATLRSLQRKLPVEKCPAPPTP